MATFRLDTDDCGDVFFVEEENGTFQTPAEQLPWENDIEPPALASDDCNRNALRQSA